MSRRNPHKAVAELIDLYAGLIVLTDFILNPDPRLTEALRLLHEATGHDAVTGSSAGPAPE